MSIENQKSLNEVYTTLFQHKMLDDVVQDYVEGKYTLEQLKFYLEWNEFSSDDIDMNKVERARNKYMKGHNES